MSFVIGDRIGLIDGKIRYIQHGDTPNYGVITDLLADGRIMVKWDSEWMNNNSKPINPKNLMAESEFKVKYSELEMAFCRVEDEVAEKLKEAGQIILDAQKIAKDAGFNITDLYEATSSLENAMESAGWNTSSWHC